MSDTSDTFDFSKSKLTPKAGTRILAVDASGDTDSPGYMETGDILVYTSAELDALWNAKQ